MRDRHRLLSWSVIFKNPSATVSHLARSSSHKGDRLVARAQREGENALRVRGLVVVCRQQIIEANMPELVKKMLDVGALNIENENVC